jgi:predicted nucleotide-binding protein
MSETERQQTLAELKDLYKKLRSYNRYLHSEKLSEAQRRYIESLRQSLVRKAGVLKAVVADLTRKQHYVQFGQTREIWNTALSASVYIGDRLTALGFCMDAANEAIGKLESIPAVAGGEFTHEDIDRMYDEAMAWQPPQIQTAEPSRLADESNSVGSDIPKAFIAHGGKSATLEKLCEFIRALGIDPLVVELLPSKGMSVDDKVNAYVRGADCGIVLATAGGIVDVTGSKGIKRHLRLNVIDEFARLRAVFPDRTILLLEKGVDLPSNISGIAYEPFARQSMDRAFTAIARELREMKILGAVKPPNEE